MKEGLTDSDGQPLPDKYIMWDTIESKPYEGVGGSYVSAGYSIQSLFSFGEGPLVERAKGVDLDPKYRIGKPFGGGLDSRYWVDTGAINRTCYATADNGAWYRDKSLIVARLADWHVAGEQGDVNWTADDAGSPQLALMAR